MTVLTLELIVQFQSLKIETQKRQQADCCHHYHHPYPSGIPLLYKAEIPSLGAQEKPNMRGLLGPVKGSVTCPPGHDHAEALTSSVS